VLVTQHHAASQWLLASEGNLLEGKAYAIVACVPELEAVAGSLSHTVMHHSDHTHHTVIYGGSS
jgi:hypothetical protein